MTAKLRRAQLVRWGEEGEISHLDSPVHAGRQYHPLAGAAAHQGPGQPRRSRQLAAGTLREGSQTPGSPSLSRGRGVRKAPLPPLGGGPRRSRPPRDGRLVLSLSRQATRAASDRSDASRRASGDDRSDRPAYVRARLGGERQEILARLGPDPIRSDADPGEAWRRLRRRRRPIGDALLDQRVISGVGNIYRNEALFLAGIHPLRSTLRVSEREWEELWRTLRMLMRRGATTGRIRTVNPLEKPSPRAARDTDDDFYVYRREVCRRCGTRLRELPLSGRRMFACPHCQT